MRTVKNYTLDRKSLWKPGHYGPTTTLTFRDKSGTHTVELSAGTSDDIDVFREGTLTYVVTRSRYHSLYAGLEAFEAGEKIGDAFCQDWEMEETLGKNASNLRPSKIARILAEYLPY